ncbi:nicotinamide riboside transporter PnuC [Legionella yabuuchiae]|uniref:nicotinamide riboside transporter PnuC n=1 Tax=Legionella yabuuchiae TaxID=376727 RepID=UPI0010561584|nr:nicotinamide riboside transporter PnuC [Legionella yabuuchiae]
MIYDLTGAIVSLIATYFFIQQNKKAWSISLIATLFNAWLYFTHGIYADMALECFYFASAAYGWYCWSLSEVNAKSATKAIIRLSLRSWVYLLIGTGTGFALILLLLINVTNSTIPGLDAFTTSMSLAAQLLMCHKVLSTWIFWLVTDAIYAVLYWHKQLPFHTVLMMLYMAMAIVGYKTWSKAHSGVRDQVSGMLTPDI